MHSPARQEGQDDATLLPNAGGFAFAVALVVAASAAGLPWRGAEAQGTTPCTAIDDDAARLACYDRALRAPPPAQAPGVPTSQAPAAVAPAPAAVAAAPAAAATAPAVSSPARAAAPAPSASRGAARDDVVPLVIVGVRALPGRGATFTAQDGTIWIQSDSQQVVGLPETPFEAEIKSGALGSYFLQPKGNARAIRVRSGNR